MTRLSCLVFVVLSFSGCDYAICAEPDASVAAAPRLLSETGLFTTSLPEVLGDGVQPYTPRFELWSDGATKRRWIRLPANGVIDTSNPDFWKFPVGTTLWKEFTRDGVRVETRMLRKTAEADDAWLMLAYVWQADQQDAVATPQGGSNVSGTKHDVPTAGTCVGCHGGTVSRVLGFSAVQLEQDAGVDLAALSMAGKLSAPVTQPVVPGSELDQEALGFLHANCAHCHNQSRPTTTGPRCYDPKKKYDFLLRTSELGSVKTTSAYVTGLANRLIVPGNANSRLANTVAEGDMPILGRELIDTKHVETLKQWLTQLPSL